MDRAHRQPSYRIRCDWGITGALAVAADVVVVVDVLSFTTALSVAHDQGTTVIPYEWNDSTAADFAAEHDAVLAVGRSVARPDGVSLSPASIRRRGPLPRLVLPSPNGSTICKRMGVTAEVYGASLRNAAAVADQLVRHREDATIAVIAAGERWPDGSLRPAVEDLWGAGAVIDRLVSARGGGASPEALVARAAFIAVRDEVGAALRDCASGRELIDKGFGSDVDIAAELDASSAVPALRAGRFPA